MTTRPTITVTIDGQSIRVPENATILDAARLLGIDIPTLCFVKDLKPSTSCLACVVRVDGRMVPACATRAIDGMQIESEADEVRAARRTAIELLLSEHLGDCLAPCQFGCPAQLDIPQMLRQIQSGDYATAIDTVTQTIPLPSVLGRVCPRPCEKVCRRRQVDQPVSICDLKRIVGDVDLQSESPYRPTCAPASGRRVAIIGAGPAGLSAAWFLARAGHGVTIYEQHSEPGGRMRDDDVALPSEVVTAEIRRILDLGVDLQTGVRLVPDGSEVTSAEVTIPWILGRYQAMLLAAGPIHKDSFDASSYSLIGSKRGVAVDPNTYQTERQGVFAIGRMIRGDKAMMVRSVADAQESAVSIDQMLRGERPTGPDKPFSVRIGKLEPSECDQLVQLAELSASDIAVNASEKPNRLSDEQAQAAQSASLCLHCDCLALDTCRLKRYAEQTSASSGAYDAGSRPALELQVQHDLIVYEPGKCIKCGLCVQITSQSGDSLGLTFVGRGFDVRIGVPFDRSLRDALGDVAQRCVEACPTAALSMR